VLDHLTPSYFTALDSVVRQLEEQLTPAVAHHSGHILAQDGANEANAGPRRVSSSSGADVNGGRAAAVIRQRAVGRGLMMVGPDGDLI